MPHLRHDLFRSEENIVLKMAFRFCSEVLYKTECDCMADGIANVHIYIFGLVGSYP